MAEPQPLDQLQPPGTSDRGGNGTAEPAAKDIGGGHGQGEAQSERSQHAPDRDLRSGALAKPLGEARRGDGQRQGRSHQPCRGLPAPVHAAAISTIRTPNRSSTATISPRPTRAPLRYSSTGSLIRVPRLSTEPALTASNSAIDKSVSPSRACRVTLRSLSNGESGGSSGPAAPRPLPLPLPAPLAPRVAPSSRAAAEWAVSASGEESIGQSCGARRKVIAASTGTIA